MSHVLGYLKSGPSRLGTSRVQLSHQLYHTQCIPVTTSSKEPGIRSVYGVSLWNHWLPGMVVTGCPGTHYSNTNHPGPHQDVTQHENLVGSATLIEGIL